MLRGSGCATISPASKRPSALNYDHMIRTCSIWRALEVVGDTPTLLILEASWLGVRTFAGFQERIGLLKALLSDRLKHLVDNGILYKRQYSERPLRFEYAMTPKGRDLFPLALMVTRWERIWGRREGKIGLELTHLGCGKIFQPTLACDCCDEELDPTKMDWEAGPGVGLMAPLYSRRRRCRVATAGTTSLHEDAAQLMGDRWSSLIMRSIFTGIRRFDDIRQDTAIATNILSERLNWLIDFGAIRAEQYESKPPRYEYRLTRKGVGFYFVLLTLMQWGDKYYCSPEGPPLIFTHRNCGNRVNPKTVCDQCHGTLTVKNTRIRVIEAADMMETV